MLTHLQPTSRTTTVMHTTMTDTLTEQQLQLREQTLSLLLKTFGTSSTNQKIYQCADEWVRKGQVTTNGLVSYFRAYYEGQEGSKVDYKKE